ncbi:hypothetical protein D3C85_1483890 [compost metagenome]
MVKPMPQRIATPNTWPQLAPWGRAAMPIFTASQVRPNTPTALPSNRPTAMPIGTSWVKLSTVTPLKDRPALAKANSGRMP